MATRKTGRNSARDLDTAAIIAIIGQKVDDLRVDIVGIRAEQAAAKIERDASFEKIAMAARAAHAEQKIEITAIANSIQPLRDDINRAKGAAAATKFLIGFAITMWSAAISFATVKVVH